MNASENASDTPRDDQPVSSEHAEPYRTPSVVPDPAPRRGLLGSPIAWLIAGGVVIGAGVFALSPRRSDRPDVIEYVEDFGEFRRGPVEDFEAEMNAETYEVQMQAAETETQSLSPAPVP